MYIHIRRSLLITLYTLACGVACDDEAPPQTASFAEGVTAPLGEIRPDATEDERSVFEEGFTVATRRFTLADGLGPHFNVTFCGSCHEKPVFGGSAGHYRDFYIYGEQLNGGVFSPSGPRSGVLTTFTTSVSSSGDSDQEEAEGDAEDTQGGALNKMDPDDVANLFTLRNPIPFFGIGLLAEIPEEELLSHADPDDADGDGISGRPNFDQGYVGRFGLKAQTVSIENFIRGPLFNHLGITTNPLSAELQAALPVPSVAEDRFDDALEEQEQPLKSDAQSDSAIVRLEVQRYHQAAAPSEPLTDSDEISDPELSERDLFALVSWAMLLAAPAPDPLDMISERGEGLFHAVGCASCHVPHLKGPRGLISPYTDLLLHDMGPELADGVVMALASGSEFRTQPLWGISATGPYLYDGRASTLDEAIVAHGGEAERSRDDYISLSSEERDALIAFLESLGGRSQRSEGLLPPESPLSVGEVWKIEPLGQLTDEEEALFLRGRALFDRDVGISDGLGPEINGDSCRGCHFEPVIGGAGPTGVSAVRQLSPPSELEERGELSHDGHLVRRFGLRGGNPPAPLSSVADEPPIYEVRQALPSFGLGVLDAIPEESIIARADPDDLDGDGVRGVARLLESGRVGRFGWRAQLPDLREFVADALSFELGLTLHESLMLSAAVNRDDDGVSDPEFSEADFDALVFFLRTLAPPQRLNIEGEEADRAAGEMIFSEIGCDACHAPRLHDAQSHAAYTDLLLHAVQGDEQPERLFRTPPLWGVASTGTYWHDGRASTLWEAIELHRGEAEGAQESASALEDADRTKLLLYLKSL